MTETTRNSLYNVLTVDWEDWYHGLLNQSAQWHTFSARLPMITDPMLDLFAEHNVKATFFILGHAAERHPDMVKKIHKAGHEIASHGYNHQFVYSQTPEAFRQDTWRAMNFLSDLISEPILGYRASTFTITEQTLWALHIIEECGFKYDSSIFPVKNPWYGIPTAPRYPYKFDGREFWEVPLTTLRLAGKNFPIAGGFYLRILPTSLLCAAYRRINHEGKPLVFYIHPWEMDLSQPRGYYNMFWRFMRYHGLKKVPRRLKQLLTQFRWSSVKEIIFF